MNIRSIYGYKTTLAKQLRAEQFWRSRIALTEKKIPQFKRIKSSARLVQDFIVIVVRLAKTKQGKISLI